MRRKDHFYVSWIVANTLAEAIGLGFTMIVGFGAAQQMQGTEPATSTIVFGALLAVVIGVIMEGVLVGVFQANVIENYLPGFDTKPWVQATAAGAAVAWILGMLPSTIITLSGLGDHIGETTVFEPSAPVQYALAAGMGLVLGPVLAVFQVRILRQYTKRYLSWLVANALAWALGMMVIFIGMDLIDWDAGI